MMVKTNETKIELLNQEMQMVKDQNTKEHSEIKSMIFELRNEFRDFIDGADDKYASKTVEKVVYGLIGTILTAIVLYALKSAGIN